MHELFHDRLGKELIEPQFVQRTLTSHRAQGCMADSHPCRESSLFDDGVIRAVPAGRLFEEEDQRQREERQNHQQFEVVDVSNDLGLQCNGGVERGAPGGAETGLHKCVMAGFPNRRLTAVT